MPNTQIHCPCCYLPLCYCYGLRQYMVSVCLAYSRLISEQVRSRSWSWSIDDYLVPVRRCCITLTPKLAPPPTRFLRISHNSVSRPLVTALMPMTRRLCSVPRTDTYVCTTNMYISSMHGELHESILLSVLQATFLLWQWGWSDRCNHISGLSYP